MALEAENREAASGRLIAAGRTLLAQGAARFSLIRRCAEAGVTLVEVLVATVARTAKGARAGRVGEPMGQRWS